ncbi:MAG: hypothetical protein K8J08_01710 [Thermoanaerobaculia bacterium]|nr:hypothetical protein [Thermoanaerobaculia bacterium]
MAHFPMIVHSWRLLGALLWLVTLPAYGSISASTSTTPALGLVPSELLEELSVPALEHEIVYRSPLLKGPTEAKTRVRASDFDKSIYPYGNRRLMVEFTVGKTDWGKRLCGLGDGARAG